jgi:hypothetical protein
MLIPVHCALQVSNSRENHALRWMCEQNRKSKFFRAIFHLHSFEMSTLM